MTLNSTFKRWLFPVAAALSCLVACGLVLGPGLALPWFSPQSAGAQPAGDAARPSDQVARLDERITALESRERTWWIAIAMAAGSGGLNVLSFKHGQRDRRSGVA